MATSVLKLFVDDKQYTASLKEAKKGMQDLQRTLESAGKSFEDCDSAVAEYARGLGKMETESRTAKGQINELSSAFIELSRVYNQMTEQERQSPVGQALSKSLDELKTRTIDAKTEMANLNKQLEPVKQNAGETGGVMGELAKKFTLNLDVMKLFNVGLQAAQGALGVVKDAFFENEAMVDEWGRTVDTAKSLYQGFLNALNNGDISGFLSNINEIMVAAVNAYNALDRLYTMQRIQAPQISAQMTENDRFRKILQTGRYVKPLDGRAPTPGLKEGDLLSPQQLKRVEEQLKNGTNTVVNLVSNEVRQAGIAIDNVYTRWGRELGMSEQEFRQGTSSMAEYDKRLAGYDLYKKWDAEQQARFARQGGRGSVDFDKSNPYIKYKNWGKFRVDGDRYGELVDLIAQRDQKMGMAYGLIGQAYRTTNRVEGTTIGQVMGRTGGGGGGRARGGGGGGGRGGSRGYVPVEGSIDAQAKKVQELQKAWRAAADDESREKIKKQIEEEQAALDKLEGKVKAPEGSLKALNEELAQLQKEQQLVTTADDWANYDKKIADVQKRIKALKGEVEELATGFAGLTNNSMGAWMSGQQQSLNNAEIGSEEYQALAANILDTKTLQNVINTAIKNDIAISPDTLEDLWGRIIGGENIPDSEWQELAETINAAIEDMDIEPIKIDVDTGNVTQVAKKTKESWQDAAQAVGAVGSALQQIEDPGAKIAGLIGQAIANIALGFAQATAASSKYGIFGWIAAIAGGLGTMISTISAIKSATAGSYAEGGIVPGNSYSGDNLTANVNSGELILTRAQSDSIARQLTSGFSGNMQLTAVVTGEQIRLALNNNSRRMGKGEYVTAK